MNLPDLYNLCLSGQLVQLNLGSGGELIPGYISVDKHDVRADVIADVTTMDLPHNTVNEIIAIHVFEHISPYKATDTLKRWCSWLKPERKLIMEMPDIDRLCAEYAKASKDIKYGILNCIYGSVNTTGGNEDVTEYHKFGWSPEINGILWDHLTWAGFHDIRFLPDQYPHPLYNFRVEAIKR
jgi:predicted SAM-dependent methyltransferase